MSVQQGGEGSFVALRGKALQEVDVRRVPALSRTDSTDNALDNSFELI
jgi:hypothetical protein